MKLLAVHCEGSGIKRGDFYSAAVSVAEKNGHSVQTYGLSIGGETFIEDFTSNIGGDLLMCRVTDPNFFIKNVRYGVKDDIAVISSAECCGLKKTMIKNPLYATSYGLGECISLAKKLGKKQIFVGLGDSATNDCGAGILCALGGRFFDGNGEEFTPVGNILTDIKNIDLSEFYKNTEGMNFTVLTDDDSRLTGKNGCSERSGVKKGAKAEEISILEENINRFKEMTAFVGVDDFDGAGASGGMGYCFKAFFGGEIKGCFDFMTAGEDFRNVVKSCDIVAICSDAIFSEKIEKIAVDNDKKIIKIDKFYTVEELEKTLEKLLK